jgi:hypothetical protein
LNIGICAPEVCAFLDQEGYFTGHSERLLFVADIPGTIHPQVRGTVTSCYLDVVAV